MAATLLLIRHAEHIEFNQRLSGRRPGISLSDHGRLQAAALGRYLTTGRIDLIETSPLERTRETAAAVAASTGAPIVVEDALLEIDMGDWSGRTLASFGDDPAWQAWNEERATARIPGGESMAEAQSRIVALIDRLAREHEGQVIALVSHSDMIRAAICHVLGLSLGRMLSFDIDPASVSRLVVGDWGGRVLSMNEQGLNGG